MLKLHTGRTHQIRVHMLSIGHPLVTVSRPTLRFRRPFEDSKYAEERLNEDKMWCPRNFLHTYRLAFLDVPKGSEESEVQELTVPSTCGAV